MSGTDDFLKSFFEECEELLESLHDGFDAMEDGERDPETLNAVFRAVHSIKGGAGAFGFTELVAFAHDFETTLDHLRAGKLDASPDLLDLFRQCSDNLSDLVVLARDSGDAPCAASASLRARLADVIGTDALSAANETPDFEPLALDLDLGETPHPSPSLNSSPEDGRTTFRLAFSSTPELYTSGNDPVALFRTLGKLGSLTCAADWSGVPPLFQLDPLSCALHWDLTIDTTATAPELREVFEFVEDTCVLEITALPQRDLVDLTGPAVLASPEQATPGAGLDALPSLGDLLIEAGEAEHDTWDDEEAPVEEAPEPETAPSQNAPPHASGVTPGQSIKTDDTACKPRGTIRVDLEKIDKLINLVGELVIKEAMLSQTLSDLHSRPSTEVAAGLESLKQLAGEIQEGVMAVRAQPVKPMFQRMARIVREAASATGKRVRLVTIGEYTEIDKTVLERLVDPLTHMVRNAIDHGLEPGAARMAAGKSEGGTVTLSAAHRSGRVMIDVADDGGGINRDTVRGLAIERGLISEMDQLSDSEIDNLLFLPGFSSKEEVSELSGRGVGLDVVRSEIQNLGGRVTIHSDPGEGTTFSISLPLTLAVLEGMVIRVADQTMVVPISAIQETLQPKSALIQGIGSGGSVLQNRGGLVPIVDLASFLGFRDPAERIDDRVLLMIETDNNQKFALVVDEIQDQRQVVIKSLETNYQQVGGIAAATILGDGRVALIIDPDKIVAAPRKLITSDFSPQLAV